jgi:hypothetical protein
MSQVVSDAFHFVLLLAVRRHLYHALCELQICITICEHQHSFSNNVNKTPQ